MDSPLNETQTPEADETRAQQDPLTATAEDQREPFILFMKGNYEMPKRSKLEAAKEWGKHPLLLLLLGSLVSSYLFPLIISRSDEARQSHEARRGRGEEIWKLNQDFNIKLNKLAVLVRVFSEQRTRRTPTELRQPQKDFDKDFSETYLAVEEAFWWPSDIERRERVRKDLSADELVQLTVLVGDYRSSVLESVDAVNSGYRCVVPFENSDAKEQVECLKNMQIELGKQYEIRAELVMKISGLFADV